MDEKSERHAWLRQQFTLAADYFDAVPVGEVACGADDRTVGGEVFALGGRRWLHVECVDRRRTGSEHPAGDYETEVVATVPKPALLGVHEWGQRERLRAELRTLVEDKPCSTTPALFVPLTLTPRWLSELRSALDALAQTSTHRGVMDQGHVTRRMRMFFGSAVDPTVRCWQTAHGNLHWANITAPNLMLLNWDSWGRRMAGFDVANLYVLALRAPGVAHEIHETFADVLDSPSGMLAQLYAITCHLKRVEHGDFADYADVLHAHVQTLLGNAAPRRLSRESTRARTAHSKPGSGRSGALANHQPNHA